MSQGVPRGKIVTFYSFKGGVGRTMALANVAFLAAMNGLRVLVIDWDLEAPGLHQYFRGIMEPEKMARLKDASGVLDLAWDWRSRIEAAVDAAAVDAVFAEYNDGAPFKRHAVALFLAEDFDTSGKIDMIPAGGRFIRTPEPVAYERALAAFSWNEFMERYTGGGLLDSLRAWASANYDLILIDSRTGLADVAGICTMQLPDRVVLAFVLNRQNIEGVARVAGAIRKARGEEVTVLTVPMRVSREGTAEEADARARAVRDLVRLGGLSRDQVERDIKSLLIKAEPNVPFLESLAPFNDTDAALDPLTANMVRLTREITKAEIAIPQISSQWRDTVQARLAPALSTEGYLRQLMSAEPLRAARDLHRFLDSALSTLADGETISDEYVAALTETGIAFQQRVDHVGALEGYDTASKVTLLLRKLYASDQNRWRSLLIMGLQTSLDRSNEIYMEDDEIAALEEIDELLSAESTASSVLFRRAEIRLRIARLFADLRDATQQLASVEVALHHLSSVRKGKNDEEIQLLRFEALLQKAYALDSLEQHDDASKVLRKLVKEVDALLNTSHRPEAARLSFDANIRLVNLARRKDAIGEAAFFAKAAMARGQPGTTLFVSRVTEMADAILAGPEPSQAAKELLSRALVPGPADAATSYLRRASRSGPEFISALARLLNAARDASPEEIGSYVMRAAEVIEGILESSLFRLGAVRPGLSVRQFKLRLQATALPMAEAVAMFVAEARERVFPPMAAEALERLARSARDLARPAQDLRSNPTKRGDA